MQKTTNYNLNQWEAHDEIKREDFNADNAAIDAALSAGARVVTGSYTGTGTFGEDSPNMLTFGFCPKLIFIFQTNYYGPFANTKNTGSCCGITNHVFYFGANSFGVYDSAYGTVRYTLSENGLTWYTELSAAAQMNAENTTYSYIAIG